MMTIEQNIRSILESNFAGFKEEIIDSAANSIVQIAKTEVKMRVHQALDSKHTQSLHSDEIDIVDIKELVNRGLLTVYMRHGNIFMSNPAGECVNIGSLQMRDEVE